MPKRTSAPSILLLIGALIFPFFSAAAVPAPFSGFSHPAGDGSVRAGLPLEAGVANYSSPVIGEIDGDEADGKEIAVAGAGGRLLVYRNDGSLLWAATMPAGSCGVPPIMSSPAVGRLFPGTDPSVVIGYGGTRKNCDGGVAAFDGRTGAMHWSFSTVAFSKKARFREMLHAVFSTPALADVDGNGTLEVGFGSFDRHVYLLNADGSVRWCYQAADTVWGSPAFANADDNPDLEMIIGTDISANRRIKPVTANGGILYALRTRPRARGVMVRFRDPTLVLWKTPVEQVLYSSAVVADVLPGNGEAEVIIGSGCYFPTNSPQKAGRWIRIFSLHSGALLQTLNSPVCSPSSVATGDVDGDGLPEIIATVNGDPSVGGDGVGRVLAWKANAPDPLWAIVPQNRGYNNRWLGQFTSPILADLDGNGSAEVVLSNGMGPTVLEGSSGRSLTCTDSSCTDGGLDLLSGPSTATPAVGDLNGDGQLELVTVGRTETGAGALFVWGGFAGGLNSASGFLPQYSTPFPMFRANAQRTGVPGF